MSSTPKGYVDTTYLDKAAELIKTFKQLTYQRMRIQPGQKVLDVGCGPGTDTIPLAQQVGSLGQVVGVDSDAEMIAEADQRALKAGVSSRVKHQRSDASALPLDSNYFDACRSERMFQHLAEPAKALSELARVTRSGGWIVVLDPDWGSLSLDANDVESERILARAIAEHLVNNPYCARQLYRLFEQQRLVDVSAEVLGLPFTNYSLARQMFLMDRAERETLASGGITAQQIEQLHSNWECADAEGVFFASMHGVLVSGRKP